MKSKKQLLLTAAMAGLTLASCAGGETTSSSQMKDSQTVMCHGVNSCKGHGDCAGKVDACSGKNGCQAELKCSGHNSCKGKGLKKMTKKECMDKKGTVAS